MLFQFQYQQTWFKFWKNSNWQLQLRKYKLAFLKIFFRPEKGSERELLFNELYKPIFDKEKVLDPSKRSVFQLLERIRKRKNGLDLNFYKYKKTYPTMEKKFFIPLYLEHIRFLEENAGWTAPKIHSHYTFKQEISNHESKLSTESKKLPPEGFLQTLK